MRQMHIKLTYNDELFGELVKLEGFVNCRMLYKVSHWGFAKELVKTLKENPRMKTHTLKGWTAERIEDNGNSNNIKGA